ncbi:hypothetical protein [Halomonas sp. PBN3]|nr:hypothetical protein [Halomonas sp. PBN3]ERS91321.1 hypothetical protein Q671_04340 [Halomonas sp. PBN3]
MSASPSGLAAGRVPPLLVVIRGVPIALTLWLEQKRKLDER